MATIRPRSEPLFEEEDCVMVMKETVPSPEQIALEEERRRAGEVAGTLFSAAMLVGFVKAAPLTVTSAVTYSLAASIAEAQVKEPLGNALHDLSKWIFSK